MDRPTSPLATIFETKYSHRIYVFFISFTVKLGVWGKMHLKGVLRRYHFLCVVRFVLYLDFCSGIILWGVWAAG